MHLVARRRGIELAPCPKATILRKETPRDATAATILLSRPLANHTLGMAFFPLSRTAFASIVARRFDLMSPVVVVHAGSGCFLVGAGLLAPQVLWLLNNTSAARSELARLGTKVLQVDNASSSQGHGFELAASKEGPLELVQRTVVMLEADAQD